MKTCNRINIGIAAVILFLQVSGVCSAQNAEYIRYNYNQRKIYIYSVTRTDMTNSSVTRDTLGLFCSNKFFNKELGYKTMNWGSLNNKEKGYEINDKVTDVSSTGIFSDDTMLFIHPPRYDYYKVLQLAPYPYLKFPLTIGRKWQWDFEVGGRWSVDNKIKWNGIELFVNKYTVDSIMLLPTIYGHVKCYKISAIGDSKFGRSMAVFYYSVAYGIVKMMFHTLKQQRVLFNIIDTSTAIQLFKQNPAVSREFYRKPGNLMIPGLTGYTNVDWDGY